MSTADILLDEAKQFIEAVSRDTVASGDTLVPRILHLQRILTEQLLILTTPVTKPDDQ